jgi:DNA-binding NarL/FixJ family response regulator
MEELQAVLNPGDLEALSRLTDREREILKLIFDGKCSSEVATIMCVSKRTVDFHLARAYENWECRIGFRPSSEPLSSVSSIPDAGVGHRSY